VLAILFGNRLYWFESQCQHVIFFLFEYVLYSQTLKLCSNTSIIELYVLKIIFSQLAGLEMRVTQIFLLFFRNSFFFVYRHSDLEGSCSNGTKTRHGESRCCLRAVAGHDIWHWAARFETFTERNCWAYDVCVGEVWTVGGLTLALFHVWGMGSEELLEQVPLNFSFRNKFIILLPCGLLVENNVFQKCAFLKVLLSTLIMVVIKTEMCTF
jgi:hypothetical protein